MTAKIEWYREVLELEPNSKVFFPLARLLEEDGQTEEAMTLLQRGVERHPEYLEARLFLIELLHKSDRREECNVQVGHLSKMFASYAGFWQAWAACLASEQGQADTASIIRFLAAHFVSGPLNLHEVLNRGLDSILGAQQAAQVWNTPAKDQNAETARQMTAAAEFAAHSEEMLEDLDAELGTAGLHAAETLADAAVDSAEPAESGGVRPDVGACATNESILPSAGSKQASVPQQGAAPAMAPELELSVAPADSDSLPVEEPAVVMAPSASAEAVSEIAVEPQLAMAPEPDAVEAGLAIGDADAAAEMLPVEESATEAGAQLEALAQPEQALEPSASAPELELSVAEADAGALPIEAPLAAPEVAIAPEPDVAPDPGVAIAPEPEQGEERVDGETGSAAGMAAMEDREVSPGPQVAVSGGADAEPGYEMKSAPEVAEQELAIGDVDPAANMLPAEEQQESMPVAESGVGAEAPDAAAPELAGGATDPVAEMLLAQDAEPALEAAAPESASGEAGVAAAALPVEEHAWQAETSAMPGASDSEIAPEAVETAPEGVAESAPASAGQGGSLFHPAAFMAPASAATSNSAQAPQAVASGMAAAEKSMQPTASAPADLPKLESDGKPASQDDFVEEEPFSLRTRSMAEVLAEQGDIQGALDIYQELAAAATSADEVEDINRRIATLSGRLKVATASAAFKVEEEEAAARSKAKLLGMLEALEEGMRARAQA